jgi:polyhydroxyalkanoate synthesis regulator phasin
VSALRGIIQSGEEFIGKLQTPVQQFKDEFRKKAEVVGESGKAVREFVDSTQRSIDELQRRMDARMRDAFDQLTHIPELRDDVTYLNDRIARLEASLHRLERTVAEGQAPRRSPANPKHNLPSSFDEP